MIGFLMESNYYIGGGDYLGNNSPNDDFNNKFVPRLLELGIKPDDMDEVANMFADVYEIGFSNGENCTWGDIQEEE